VPKYKFGSDNSNQRGVNDSFLFFIYAGCANAANCVLVTHIASNSD
jgi:hypothetical protein